MPAQPLLEDNFLRAQWGAEFEAFQSGPESAALLARLRAWAARDVLNERSSETAFIAGNTDDELILHIGGREALRLYDKPDTPFLAAQWRHALRDLNITEAFNATRLAKLLLTLRSTTEAPLRDRILALDREITTLDITIAERESALNAITYRLYGLTPEEIAMVEGG